MIRSLLRIGQRTFCSKATADAATQANSAATLKPKWMKFFEGQDPIKIDLERSIKSENLDLIQNYIKTNYLQFDDFQLVQIIPKVCRSQVLDRVKSEMRLRIVSNNFNLTVPQYYILLDYLEEINFSDRILVLFTLSKISEHMREYDHLQQFKIIQLGVKINKLSVPLALTFLDYFSINQEQFKSPEFIKSEYLDKLDHISFTQYITLLSNLKDLLVPDEFNSRVSESVLKIITDTYLEKMSSLDKMNDHVSQLHLDKIFNPDVVKILPYNSKIAYKKLLIKTLELRFDNETQLGKYSFYKNDKGNGKRIFYKQLMNGYQLNKQATSQKALGILRSIVQPNERELVEKVLILIGNQIMSRELSDFKFDFRLFSYLTKYQYAYKYYIDESFISMKSLIRSLIFNTKKLTDENDHNVYHIVFQKYKAYNDLNYYNIIKQSEDVYTRKVDFSDSMVNQWNQLQKDVQACLKDYLSQQVASGLLTKLLFKIPSPVDKEEDENVQDENELDLLAIEEATEDITDDNSTDQKKNGFDSGNQDESSRDSSNSDKAIKDEDYRKQIGYKLIEFQAALQQQKYAKFVSYNTRILYNQTILLRYFINSTECIAQNLYFCEPTDEFLTIVKLWAKQDKLNEIFDHFCMIPSFLESLIMIEAYGKIYKGQSWFSPELTNKIFKMKFQLEEHFHKEQDHKEREPFKYVKNIEQEIESLPSKSLPLDKAYDQHNFLFEIISNSYSVSNALYESQKQKTSEMSEDKIILQRKRDLLTEQFIYNKDNLLRKIIHSQVYSYFVNESHLKRYTGDVLNSLTNSVQKNVVFYPFYADFVLPNKKIAIQILEKNKMIDGVENTLSGFNQLNEIFLKKIGYNIVYIEYSDFEIDFKSFQNNILKKISKFVS